MDHILFDEELIASFPKLTSNNNNSLNYFSLSYLFKFDYRDDPGYPLKGHYFDVLLKQNGLGILNSDAEHLSITTEFRKYFEIFEPLYFAVGGVGFAASRQDIPYFFRYALGYHRNIVRGYEPYVIDAQQFIVLKSNFKWRVFQIKEKRLNILKTEKFDKVHLAVFLNAFADYGYARENFYMETTNTLTNRNLIGYGLGIDFVTYYDKVLRIEYSFNHKNESGIYVHLIAPI